VVDHRTRERTAETVCLIGTSQRERPVRRTIVRDYLVARDVVALHEHDVSRPDRAELGAGIRELGSCKTGADTDKAERERDTGDQLKCFSH
jgi:hypothetical protein